MAVSLAGRTTRKLAVNSPLKRSKNLCCHTTNAKSHKSLFQECFGFDASKSYTPTSPFSTSQKLFKSTPAKGTYVNLIRSQQVIKDNDEECVKVLLSPESRFLPYFKSQPLIQEGGHEPVLLTQEEIQPLIGSGSLQDKAVWLQASHGEKGGLAAIFAIPVETEDGVLALPSVAEKGGKFTNLRLAMLFIGSQAPILSQGFSLLRWHRVTKFCASCGSANIKKSVSGNRRVCGDCGTIYYPPTSPTGISLVSSPDHSKVLLQRNPKYPKGMYSCIAGFVDVGETLYDCLKREVAEEGGVELLPGSSCELLASQHWPFPAGSLMMGCMVYADPDGPAGIPSRDGPGGEIEDVGWFTAEAVRDALKFIDTNPKMRLVGSDDLGGKLFVPPRGTIANMMLTAFINKYHGGLGK